MRDGGGIAFPRISHSLFTIEPMPGRHVGTPARLSNGHSNARRRMVFAKVKIASACAGLIGIVAAATTDDASAVTAEVAKKCAALTARVYPPRVPGNPAAGSARGSGLSQQDYFRRCVANGGSVGGDDSR
jgi:hypothetical protein